MGSCNRVLSDQDKIDVVTLYKRGYTSVKLGKMYGVHGNSICGILKRRGVERRRRVYDVDESYFREINTEDRAYWFGFILADGNVHKKTLTVELQGRDRQHLENFRFSMRSLNPLSYRESKNSYALHVHSDKMVQDLAKHGCLERKTCHVCFPHIESNLCRHFVRGYFDGDGWITSRMHSGKWKIWQCGLSSSSEKIIKETHNWTIETIGRSFGSTFRTGRGHYRLDFSGKRSVLSFLGLLYDDASVFLHRKMELYKQIV